ncbi:AMP-binding protein, partial [Neorhizobium sp. DT-125]|uniref:AMP-binding protein n=1 Tax=Neorhizobium sp. DT-125 TaxID=3396163 RepID=UPI003F199B71
LSQIASAGEGTRLGELTLTVPVKHPTPVDYPFVAVTERIARQAVLAPETEALVCEGERISYGELEAWANRIARRLTALGVGPDERVGLAVDRSPGLVAALIGIIKAGAAYVPLDPSYPADRLAHMIGDSAIAKVVTDEASAATLSPLLAGRHTVLVSDVGGESGEPFAAPIHPDQLAYVIYTSGSTGTPKGVGVTHANVARLLDATAPWYGFGPFDVWTMFHSYAFDFSVWEIFGALCHGGRLVIVPHWIARDATAFHDLLRQEKVTVLNQTPSAFLPLAQIDASSDHPLTDLKTVVFGGEKLEPAALRGWLAARGEAAPQLINMYGIT